MAVFSINQVRQLYVAKELKTGNALLATDKAGAILPKADTAKTTLYLQYMSPAGIVSSDKINIANVMYAKATVFDLILPRMAAGIKIERRDIIRMGHGGLCLGCKECHYPVCPFGKEA